MTDSSTPTSARRTTRSRSPGREAELAKLDAWLAQDQAFALVTAPAGRGKSALLTRWAMNVAGRRDADVVFVPISLRHQTTRPVDVLSLLGERLAWVVSGVDENRPPDTADDWRRIARALTNVTPARRRPLLIVVDEADEIAGWQDTRLPLPMTTQPGVKGPDRRACWPTATRRLAGLAELARRGDRFHRAGLAGRDLDQHAGPRLPAGAARRDGGRDQPPSGRADRRRHADPAALSRRPARAK